MRKLPAFSRLPSPTSSFADLLELEGTSPQELEEKLSAPSTSVEASPDLLARARSALAFILLFLRMLLWRCVGLMDNLYILTRWLRGRQRPLFYSDGWGDLDVIRNMFMSTCEDLKRGSVMNQLTDAGTIMWEAKDVDGLAESFTSMNVRKGSFRSPTHRSLPVESQDCHIEMCYPKGTSFGLPWDESSGQSPKELVLLLPATGEETVEERRQLAHALVQEGGVCSIIPTAPYYGSRRPAGQSDYYVRTVADYLIQSAALTFEAAHIMRCFAARWPGLRLCLAGFSWGGAMSGVVGIVGSQCLPDKSGRVVAVPYAGSPTAAVIADGVLAADIDWNALAADASGSSRATMEGTRSALLKELLAMHLSSFTDALREGERNRNALDGLHAVCFRDDSFVKIEYADELYQLLASCSSDGAAHVEQQWLGGGHARAYFSKGSLLPRVVLRALRAA